MSWQPPPELVLTKCHLEVIDIIFILKAKLLFQIINVRLVIFDSLQMLLTHLVGEKSKQKALYKSENTHYKDVWIIWLVHVHFSFFSD